MVLTVGFDLDLTLLDTRELVVTCLARTLDEVGLAYPREALAQFIGPPLRHTWGTLAPGLEAEALTRRYRALHAAADAPAAPPMPGAVAALQAVRDRGGTTMVVSAKTYAAIGPLLAASGLSGLLDVVVGDRFATEKSAALREHGARIYVGDHTGDIAAARGAECLSVAVATGPCSAARLASDHPDVLLDDLTRFPPWLAAWPG